MDRFQKKSFTDFWKWAKRGSQFLLGRQSINLRDICFYKFCIYLESYWHWQSCPRLSMSLWKGGKLVKMLTVPQQGAHNKGPCVESQKENRVPTLKKGDQRVACARFNRGGGISIGHRQIPFPQLNFIYFVSFHFPWNTSALAHVANKHSCRAIEHGSEDQNLHKWKSTSLAETARPWGRTPTRLARVCRRPLPSWKEPRFAPSETC